ncbi:Hsp70 family protein [Mycobacterium manitobense]|uniref:Hsp70 family protein n=1 Tax=[Mycobacterium] manitobense TaxID=190147 RepID=A0A9X3BUK4_9MYCO|nr:Hsp70 family protein [[Mycobacterium] manitobense]MCV7168332.1 Hsp70 family protein [[Mycobacterium] manitobense]
MADGLGLSVGATRLTAVVVGRTALTRSPVLTQYPHRPAEVGVPSENPELTERGLILTDFVDRVGDPVGIVAADGTSHRGEVVLADALRALLRALTRGQAPADPVAVSHPAHWRPAAVDALRGALAAVPDFGAAPVVVSDAATALTALQDDPGLPTSGVVALCDFGGTGTSITLADAGNGFTPIGPTVRHPDFSGAAIDQALLTRVINDLSAAGDVDLTGTSAIGSLTRLRGQCRAAKERLSSAAVTSLAADLPGRSSEVRLTRAELDDAVRQPLADFVAVVHETLERAGVRTADLAAVASTGGGARVPVITATLSESFRVPVVTNPQPELAAAIGAGLAAVRGGADNTMTAMAAAPAAAALAGAAQADDMSQSSTFRALAWSDADDIPDVAATDHYEYDAPADSPAGDDRPAGSTTARPVVAFGPRDDDDTAVPPVPWYRRPPVIVAVGALIVLLLVAFAAAYALSGDDEPATTPTTTPTTTTAPAPPPAAPGETPAPQTQAPPPETVYETAPPPAAPESPAPPPPSEAPPPPPPPTTTAPPPPPETTQPPASTTRPPIIPTLPYTTIPGLPFVPAPPPIGGN